MRGRIVLPLLLLLGCKPPQTSPLDALAPGEVVIAHTNDLHAHFRPNTAPWLAGSPEIGGFRAIDAWIDALERVHGPERVLYLDAGDILTGTPLMEYKVRGAEGGAMLEFLEAAGCDAWALGNHELDRGWANTAALVQGSGVPVVSANVRSAEHPDEPGFPGMAPAVVLDAGEVKVGVFGLTTDGLSTLASPETMARLHLAEPYEAARAQVAALRPQVDLVVALTHSGLDADRMLAAAVGGIDVIVGGHSHTSMSEPETVGNTLIVQAGSYARQLGVLRLRVSDGKVRGSSYNLVDLDPVALPGPASEDVIALVDEWGARIDDKYRRPIGTAPIALTRQMEGQESLLGRWSAEVVRAGVDADVGIYNRGGIRADLPAGEITLGHLYEVFPFNNEVVVFEARGDELVGILLENIAQRERGWNPRLTFSGVEWSWTHKMDSPELVDVTVAGATLDPGRVYRVATNSYVAEQWQKHLGFEPRALEGAGMTVREAAESLARTGPARAPLSPVGQPVR